MVGLVVLAVFVWYETRTDHPSLDVQLFRDAAVLLRGRLGRPGLLRRHGHDVLPRLLPAAGARLHAAAGRPADDPVRGGPADLRAAQRGAWSSGSGRRRSARSGSALVTVGLAGFALVGATTPIWVLIVLTFVQGAGMANVIPPATESIMSSLPREKAGVGSAVSNTVRQVGGALGVAVLGSVLSARLPRPDRRTR